MVAVQVRLLNDLVGHKLHLLRLQLVLAAQTLDRVNQIFLREVPVAVKVWHRV